MLPVSNSSFLLFLHPSSLIISVTGGAKAFILGANVKKILTKGLKRALSKKGVWMITGGTKSGVMELIGEIIAYQASMNKPVPLIGIGKLGEGRQRVKGKENRFRQGIVPGMKESVEMADAIFLLFEIRQLILFLITFLKPIATWNMISNNNSLFWCNQGPILGVEYKPNDSKEKVPLDPNHTIQLLVDHGQPKYGGEIKFRASFERSLAECKEGRVPVVLLVIQGGMGTIKSVISWCRESSFG